jgi:hypothetical protein
VVTVRSPKARGSHPPRQRRSVVGGGRAVSFPHQKSVCVFSIVPTSETPHAHQRPSHPGVSTAGRGGGSAGLCR